MFVGVKKVKVTEIKDRVADVGKFCKIATWCKIKTAI